MNDEPLGVPGYAGAKGQMSEDQRDRDILEAADAAYRGKDWSQFPAISEAPEPQGPTTEAGRRFHEEALDFVAHVRGEMAQSAAGIVLDMADDAILAIEAEASAAAPPDIDVRLLATAIWHAMTDDEVPMHERPRPEQVAAEYRRLASPDATRREPE